MTEIIGCFVCLFVWVDALSPRLTAEVMSGRSVILSTPFLGKPPEAGNQYLAHILGYTWVRAATTTTTITNV